MKPMNLGLGYGFRAREPKEVNRAIPSPEDPLLLHPGLDCRAPAHPGCAL